METSFPEHYASLNDDELLHIAGDRKDLLKEAAVALDVEMARRGLTHEHAQTRKRDYLRLEFEEARGNRRKRKKSKYFVAQINLPAYFIGLVVLLLLMFLTLGHHRVPDEWSWPLIVVYVGALIACLAVQPWVRQTLSFWFSLAVSFFPQFVVARWLAVSHPTYPSSATKGSALVSIIPGYLLGIVLFRLLQRLKPGQEPKATN